MLIDNDAKEKAIQEQLNAEARAYLTSTDWYVVRETETGETMPEDVKTKRAEARAKVVTNA